MTAPSRDLNRFLVRMPDGMRDRIAEIAKANGRSMNAEIVRTLEEAYPDEPVLDDLIHHARDVAKIYQEDPSNGLLRQLRDILNDLVATAEAERKNVKKRGR